MTLSEQTRQEIEAALVRYPERRTAVLDALRAAQKEKGHLGAETLREVAEGKLIAEIDFDAIAKAEDAKTKWNLKHVNVNSLYSD